MHHRRLHRRIVAGEAPDLKKRAFTPTAVFPGQQASTTETEAASSQPTTHSTTTTTTPVAATTTSTSTTPRIPETTSTTSTTARAATTTSSTTALIPIISISTHSTSTTLGLTTSTTVTTPTTAPTTANTVPTVNTQAEVPTTQGRGPNTTFVTAPRAATSSVSSVSASETAEPASTGNGGKIVGGIFGALGGLVAICVIIAFILRRWRKRLIDRDGANFDAGTFRRSAVMLQDPQPESRGHSPRPPSIIERKMQTSTPMSFGTQYGRPGPQGQGYGATQQYQQYQQPYYQQYPGMSPPNSGNPLMAPSPFSPGPVSPTTSQYGPAEYANLGPQPYLTRSNSAGSQGSNNRLSNASVGMSLHNPHSPAPQYAAFADPGRLSTPMPTGEYVDATRSSVTPFQEAQYVAISQQLNAVPPQGLNTPAVDAYVQSSGQPAQPASRPPTPPNKEGASPIKDTVRESVHSEFDTHALDFPAPPPSPGPNRMPSTPPTLPEIRVESRGSFNTYDFPASVSSNSSTPVTAGFPSGVTAANGQALAVTGTAFPTTPSPLASSFAIDTPPNEPSSPVSPSSPHPSLLVAGGATPRPAAAPAADKKRPETVYDDDDAYGGI
ncbi:hypothetical protein VNI00_002970 [Paramarasmius palmivorus]|uniref:Uncharacterized protein n=1 Tax=Paramarasmius palmivorus TaxID=297713 RepID=A0AAW0DXD4_9AGAR